MIFCDPIVLLIMAALLAIVGIVLWVIQYRRAGRLLSGGVRAFLAFGMLILAIPAAVTAAVTVCPAGTSGACPPSFPAGSTGYTCSNKYEQCGFVGLGNCLTIAGTMPWDSDCECKCVNTAED